MRKNRHSLTCGLILILAIYLPQSCTSHPKESNATTTMDNLTQEDYEAMLAVNNMKVYKFPVKIPEEQKCIVVLYRQEFEHQKKIEDKDIVGSNSPHKKVVDRKVVVDDKGDPVYTPLDGIRVITKEEGNDIALGVRFGEIEIPSTLTEIDTIYSEKHFVKSFGIPEEFAIGSEIPLVLLGSAWNSTNVAGNKEMSKFCWGEYEGITPDFSQKQFKKMPHYIIYGIRILEPQ